MRLIKKYGNIVILVAALLFASCEQIRFVDIGENEPRLVLNGILSTNNGLWVNVTESTGATTPVAFSFIPVEDAIVSIYHSDSMILSVSDNVTGNYYTSDFHPPAGGSYRIEVEAPGLPAVQSTVTIPERVEITGIDTAVVRLPDQSGSGFYNPGDVVFYIDLVFKDPPEEGNYYMIGAYYLENEHYIAVPLDIEDLDVNIYILDGLNVIACSDENFNGREKEFNTYFRLNKPEGFYTEIYLVLYSIEEPYFNYMKSYSRNFTVLNEDMILYEPVMVYSNIEDGYGIISGVSSSSSGFAFIF